MRVVPQVHGEVSPGFEGVREAFVRNFHERGELGGACCAYVRGRPVVDIWGGLRAKATRRPWKRDTMVLVYSATKGLAAMTLALAHSRGWLDYDAPVAEYWPEFGRSDKAAVTVRQLLAHQAGLFALDQPVTRDLVADADRLAEVLARQKPAWTPGSRQAYHGITLGFYEGELLRRVDPDHRTLGRFFHEEIALPLGLDFYIGLPESIRDYRLATLEPPSRWQMIAGFKPRFAALAFNPRSNIRRALRGSELVRDAARVYSRDLEIPAGGGVGTARAIARAYGVFATGGHELGLRKDTIDLLMAPAISAAHGFHDECMKSDVEFSLGFMKPNHVIRFGSPCSFGAPGAGGAMGFADPAAGVGYGYVTSQMGTTLTGDRRDVALRDALYSAIAATTDRRPVGTAA